MKNTRITMLNSIKTFLASFTLSEKKFLFCVFMCAICITSEYAISRSASSAFFISFFSVKFLPFTWVATVPASLFLVFLYNRFLPTFGCQKIFSITISLILLVNIACIFLIEKSATMVFIHSVWKEIYILLIFQQLWSVINSTITITRAKYLYGIIFGIGGIGGVIGGLLSAKYALLWGSAHLFILSCLFCILLTIAFYFMLKTGNLPTPKAFNVDTLESAKPSIWMGIKLIKNSRFLTCLLIIVILIQLGSALTEYQFNTILQREVLDLDLRTKFYAKVFIVINACSAVLQFAGTFLLVQLLGLKNCYLLLPIILVGNGLATIFYPTLRVMSFSFTTLKCFEYSIFGILKEMLYIPLKTEEKFHSKAVIDIFAYRSAKIFASVLIMTFQFMELKLDILNILSFSSAMVFVLWLLIVPVMFRHTTAITQTSNKIS